MHKAVLTILAALALLLTGCGGDSDSETTAADTTASESKPFRIPAPPPKIVYADKYFKFKPNGLFGPEPKPIIPDSPPPDELALTDLIEGIGPIAYEGDELTVQYVGYVYETGKKFDSSWDRGKPLTFKLGAGEVIEGWEEGLIGFEAADRREIIVPPDLGYGSKRVGKIPPNSTLVYVIDLLKVNGEYKT